MIELDDVRERVMEGVAVHGWGAVLWQIANDLSADADDLEAGGLVTSATLFNAAAYQVRTASECIKACALAEQDKDDRE